MSIDLNKLNEQQKDAVLHKDGPLLILAGAGSGKTSVVINRIGYLLEHHKIRPENILGVTFTNKAAEEMRERAMHLVGSKAKNITLSTFHSFCARLLRREIYRIQPFDRNFTITDSKDTEALIKTCLKEFELDEKQHNPTAYKSWISYFKNELVSATDASQLCSWSMNPMKTLDIPKYIDVTKASGLFRRVPQEMWGTLIKVYERYNKKMITNKSLDFDDLIFMTVRLFFNHPELLNSYQEVYKYIMVDEYQDTNHAQYILSRMLAAKYRNICVVGDDFQCLPEGTLISTVEGRKDIKDITIEDKIIVANGHGKKTIASIEEIYSKRYNDELVKIKTASGKELIGTPEHIVYTRITPEEGRYYVYLMYRKDFGFRIGRTSSVRARKDKLVNGFEGRLNQERGDKIWILETCESLDESIYFENYYSYKYGIPQYRFVKENSDLIMNQELINKLYNAINTEERAKILLKDKKLFIEYPHHVPQATTVENIGARYKMNFVQFGTDRFGSDIYSHELSACSIDERFGNIMNRYMGVTIKKTVTDTTYYNGRKINKNYDDCWETLKSIERDMSDYNFNIQLKAKLTQDKFNFTPMSHIVKGMFIAIEDENGITEDVITEIEFIHYEGLVYDINVPKYRNFIANGFVTHNCIYSFRNADMRNILEFEKDYPETRIVKLEQNYRSTQNILDMANKVISNNPKQRKKNLWTSKGAGESIKYNISFDTNEEADYVVEQIKQLRTRYRLSEFCILYRVNAQSRAFEDALIKSGIGYNVVGGVSFYERKEIKDIIAYLKVLFNLSDGLNLARVINEPKRGIGDTTIDKAIKYAGDNDISLWDALNKADKFVKGSTLTKLNKFVEMMNILKEYSATYRVGELVEIILDDTGYRDALIKENSEESLNRLDNLKEFLNIAWEYQEKEESNLEGFLERISLVQDDSDDAEKKERVKLMTIHGAKGLEFPVVFLVGMEENMLPYWKSIQDDMVEEERRLCYVGVTRAKEVLFITRAIQRRLYQNTNANELSRFLYEMGIEQKPKKNCVPW